MLSTSGGEAGGRSSMRSSVSSVNRSSFGSARLMGTPQIDKIRFDHTTGKLQEVKMHRDLTADREDAEERSIPRREDLTVSLIEGRHQQEGVSESSVASDGEDSYDGPICEPVQEKFSLNIGSPVVDDETLGMLGRKLEGPRMPAFSCGEDYNFTDAEKTVFVRALQEEQFLSIVEKAGEAAFKADF